MRSADLHLCSLAAAAQMLRGEEGGRLELQGSPPCRTRAGLSVQRLGSAVSIFELPDSRQMMKTILTLVKRIKMALTGVEREGVRGTGKPEYSRLL